MRFRSTLGRPAAACVAALCFAWTISALPARAQEASVNRAANAPDDEVNPKVVPGLVRPNPAPSGRKGPLAPIADRLADSGLVFHALSIDFFEANPTSGLRPGHVENSMYNILGADLDLSRRFGLQGASLHYETTIFTLNANYGFLGQVGDSMLGYQGTANTKPAILSVATFEQKLLDDRLDFEIGRTHPNRYYALPVCQSLDSCFQDVLYFNGFTSPQYSVWGTNLSYKISPTLYAEAGAFAANDGARIGYDLGRENNTGVLGIAELGRKTDFDTEAYPSRAAVTGFFNSSSHQDLTRLSVTQPGATFMQQGTSGVVVQASKIVWRADGGREKDLSPMAIALYGSAGSTLDSTTPILAQAYVGATLQSPFAGRPADRFGVKVAWERINTNYAAYLAAANLAAGGTGAPFNPNKYVFELNAHIQLPAGLAFEPVLQYAVNLNSYYNPATSLRPRDGIYAAGVLIIPVGALLGLVPG